MFYVLLIAYCFNVPIIQLRNQSIILQKFNYYKNQFPRGERERERKREREKERERKKNNCRKDCFGTQQKNV